MPFPRLVNNGLLCFTRLHGYLCVVKKAFFLIIASGILLSQLYIPKETLLEEGVVMLVPVDATDDSLPIEPLEDFPEESEKEDSKEDNDSKKWQQHRLFIKGNTIRAKVAWTILDAKLAAKPHLPQVQQPPEALFYA